MQNNEKQLCPDCRIEMDFHAWVSERRNTTGRLIIRSFPGILQEFHSCPKCGKTATADNNAKS